MASEPGVAYAAALRGDHAAALALAENSGDPSVSVAWRLALRAVLAGAFAERVRRPTVEEIAAVPPPAPGLALACAQVARAAFVSLDRETLAAALEPFRMAVEKQDVTLRLFAHALSFLDGKAVDREELRLLELDAARSSDAPVVVDAASLRALVALEEGELSAARTDARRAVRMARTEELPPQQYLAGIALSRVRRWSEQPHLAIRILAALGNVAPSLYHPWIERERSLAGDLPDSEVSRALAEDDPPLALARLTDAGATQFVRTDLDTLREVIDVRIGTEQLTGSAGTWIDGRVDSPPRGLAAIAGSRDPDTPLCLVQIGDGRPRRFFGAGAGLSSAPVVCSSRPGRLETAVSVLALAPNGRIDAVEFFEAVYRFEYQAEIHKGPLEVLLHRVRQLLGEHASIDRKGPELTLIPLNTFVVPDPRCRRSIDDDVLRALASDAASTAKDAAAALGAPLRSIQHALRRLVEDGACVPKKIGRKVTYRIEDTTFSEPTRVRS